MVCKLYLNEAVKKKSLETGASSVWVSSPSGSVVSHRQHPPTRQHARKPPPPLSPCRYRCSGSPGTGLLKAELDRPAELRGRVSRRELPGPCTLHCVAKLQGHRLPQSQEADWSLTCCLEGGRRWLRQGVPQEAGKGAPGVHLLPLASGPGPRVQTGGSTCPYKHHPVGPTQGRWEGPG